MILKYAYLQNIFCCSFHSKNEYKQGRTFLLKETFITDCEMQIIVVFCVGNCSMLRPPPNCGFDLSKTRGGISLPKAFALSFRNCIWGIRTGSIWTHWVQPTQRNNTNTYIANKIWKYCQIINGRPRQCHNKKAQPTPSTKFINKVC